MEEPWTYRMSFPLESVGSVHGTREQGQREMEPSLYAFHFTLVSLRGTQATQTERPTGNIVRERPGRQTE